MLVRSSIPLASSATYRNLQSGAIKIANISVDALLLQTVVMALGEIHFLSQREAKPFIDVAPLKQYPLKLGKLLVLPIFTVLIYVLLCIVFWL